MTPFTFNIFTWLNYWSALLARTPVAARLRKA
jgi:hypothetical protein